MTIWASLGGLGWAGHGDIFILEVPERLCRRRIPRSQAVGARFDLGTVGTDPHIDRVGQTDKGCVDKLLCEATVDDGS